MRATVVIASSDEQMCEKRSDTSWHVWRWRHNLARSDSRRRFDESVLDSAIEMLGIAIHRRRRKAAIKIFSRGSGPISILIVARCSVSSL